jgi:cation diffusion facilitator CzcD-associated flavoprotein CzcO
MSYIDRTGSEPIINERDRRDYYTPSQALFAQHCAQVAVKYGLEDGMIRKEEVVDIDFGLNTAVCNSKEVFTVRTSKKIRYARTVVLAIGPANPPRIPGMDSVTSLPGACHSMRISQVPHDSVANKIKRGQETNVLIIGGGLTSAQIADQAIRKGVTKVWLLMRGQVKGKKVPRMIFTTIR